MRKYLAYLLKKRFPVYLSLLITYVALFLIFTNKDVLLQKYPIHDDYGYLEGYHYYIHSSFHVVYSVAIFASVIIIPFFEFGFKMHRISVEQAYSLPIKREKFYLSRFIVGFVEIIVPFIVAYLVSMISLASWAGEYINIPGLFGVLGVLIISGLLTYSVSVFFVCQANNVVDSIVTMVLVCFVLLFVMLAICLLFGQNNYDSTFHQIFGDQGNYCLFGMAYLVDVLAKKWVFSQNYHHIASGAWVFWVLAGILAFIGQYFASKNFKSENGGQKSESYFCYKVMLPIVSIAATILLCKTLYYVYYGVIIIVITYFVFVIYRRSFKLGKFTWILFGSVALMDLIVMALCASTV